MGNSVDNRLSPHKLQPFAKTIHITSYRQLPFITTPCHNNRAVTARTDKFNIDGCFSLHQTQAPCDLEVTTRGWQTVIIHAMWENVELFLLPIIALGANLYQLFLNQLW